MSELTIEVQAREERGKNANRRLRAAGLVPAVVYGGGKDTVAIHLERKALHELIKSEGGENAVFLLELAGTGKSRHAMIRDLDVDPISRQIRHVDFLRILMTEKVKVQVPVELVGLAFGVKNEGGVLDFMTREIELECLPNDIPPKIEIDVSELRINDHVEVKDLALSEKVTLLEEPSRVVASVSHSRVAADIEELEAEEGLEPTLIEAEQEEPEVITRGKEAASEEPAE